MYSLKEISKKFNLNPHTLRYYEKEGLLREVQRNTQGIRIYSEENIQQLENIQCLKKAGLSLKEIQTFLYEFNAQSSAERAQFFQKQAILLQNKIQDLQASLEWTEYKIWYYKHLEELPWKGQEDCCKKMVAYYQEEVKNEKR